MKKTTLAIAIAALASATPFAQAIDWKLNGELAVELTDAESSDDLDLDVTTTDLVLTISEKFGEVDVEGFIAYEKGDEDAGDPTLVDDGAGITVSGSFGSVFVGDDGTGVFAGDVTDVLYNNSEAFFADPTTNVIDYGLPLGDTFSLNLFVDITDSNSDDPATTGVDEESDKEDIDAIGAYGSYGFGDFTFLLGYTSLTKDGAYATGDDDDILDAAVAYASETISAGVGYQDQDSAVDPIISAFVTYSVDKFSFTPYVEDAGDAGDVVAFNVSYNFTDNFYLFFETASYEDDTSDNSEIGLVLTF